MWKDGYAGRCLEAGTFDAWEVDEIHGEIDDISRVACGITGVYLNDLK